MLLFPVPLLIYALLWLHDHLAKPRSLIKRARTGRGFGPRGTELVELDVKCDKNRYGGLVAFANPGWIIIVEVVE